MYHSSPFQALAYTGLATLGASTGWFFQGSGSLPQAILLWNSPGWDASAFARLFGFYADYGGEAPRTLDWIRISSSHYLKVLQAGGFPYINPHFDWLSGGCYIAAPGVAVFACRFVIARSRKETRYSAARDLPAYRAFSLLTTA